MRFIRRSLQVVALVGTITVGVVAVALIVSQTPWFRDWLRRYIVRESKQYLNGELSIGGLGGNLLFGVNLSDVAVDVSGERVLAVKGLQIDYSVFEMISKGIVLDEIVLNSPSIRLERDGNGWNLARLVKKQEEEADRKGPGRPVSLESIQVTDASVVIDDPVGTSGYRLPERIEGLQVKGNFEYEPVHYTLKLEDVSFRGTSPQFTLQKLAGGIAVRDDNLYVENLQVRTGDSALSIEGVIENYLETPIVKLTTTGNVSLPEIGRVVPAAEGYALSPSFTIKASGPADRLALDVNVRSEAGNVKGQLTTDVKAPDLGVRGEVDVERLNLAPILKAAARRSDLTGHAKLDLTIPSAPASAPVADRLKGSFAFTGRRIVAEGYTASNVRVTGAIDGSRITLDGRADAYGGTATAKGSIVTPAPGRPLAFDLRGSANELDLRRLPAVARAPRLATDLSVAEYHIQGSGPRITGSATLNTSTVEGATIADGTVAGFTSDRGAISYTARGQVADLNLQRIGRAFKVAALDRAEYASRINSRFDVSGSGTTVERMKLDAVGELTDSDALGAHFPQLGFEAHMNEGALAARANGRFERLDPGRLSGRPDLNGSVTGTVNGGVQIAKISAPITPDALTADGKVSLEASTVGGLRIDTGEIDARYASQVGDITALRVAGPDVKLEASGRLALDRTTDSNLKYHVEAINLPELARLAGQEGVEGWSVLDGTLTGNAAALRTTGTLNGSGLGYQNNRALDLNSQYTVTIPELQFGAARVEATTSATFVKAGALEINEVKATTTYADKRLEFATTLKQPNRQLDAKGDVILHPDHQEVHLPSLALRTQGVEWQTAAGSAATIKYGGDRIQLDDVRLVSGDQSLNLSGAFALKGEQPSGALKVEAKNVDLAQIEQLTLQNRGFTGRLNANATIEGTAAAPAVDGHVEIANGGFQTYKYQSLTADVDYQATRVGIDATLQQSPTESITAKGSVPTSLFRRSEGGHVPATSGDEVDLHVTSSALSLGIVQGFTNQVTNVTGTVQADVHITGSGEDPHVQGFVDIKGGTFGVPAGGVTYSGLDTRIELTPDAVRIPNLQITDEEGEKLTMSGELGVHARQVGAVDIKVTSQNFEVIDNELGDVGVDTEVSITGELRRPKIVGSIRLEAARLEVDKILALFYDPYSVSALPEVVSAERTAESSGSAEEATRKALARAQTSAAPPGAEQRAAEQTPAAPGGAFAPVEINVKLRIPENLVLRGNDLRPGGPTGAALGDMNITVGGNLEIRKQPAGPVLLLGQVDTVRGTYEFQGRRFDLVRGGNLRFTGETQINPLLDISATRQIPNVGVEARVHVTGSAKAPELQLSSNPPLDESDILSLIVFNRSVNELGSGERASLAATAGGIATGFIAAPLGESIGRALDLDLFEITTTTESGDLGAGLTVGQQVGDRAFFKLRQQFGERNSSEFQIEYQLAHFLRLQASAAPETSGSANRLGQRRIERMGIDLVFFFSY
jgi:translocation and assembly module TamB